jgi:hypothetical protein
MYSTYIVCTQSYGRLYYNVNVFTDDRHVKTVGKLEVVWRRRMQRSFEDEHELQNAVCVCVCVC